MTLNGLLEALKQFIEDDLKELILKVPPEYEDAEDLPRNQAVKERPIIVYKQRTPIRGEEPLEPYIQLVIANGKDDRTNDGSDENTINVRMGIVIYDEKPDEGALTLMHIVEKLRFDLQSRGQVGDRFILKKPFEFLFYEEETENYHIAEISTVWQVPAVQQQIPFLKF
ncbi:MAG: hypothetical protein LUE11_04765 [Clostridia bacterium]|nr:hypothetical protein [Clostridia bacterium]